MKKENEMVAIRKVNQNFLENKMSHEVIYQQVLFVVNPPTFTQKLDLNSERLIKKKDFRQ